MYQSEYFIDKSSNTFADNLAAFGLAFVLNSIADGRATIFLEDNGAAFVVRCTPALQQEWVEQCQFFTGADFLVTVDRKSETRMVKGTKLTPALVPSAIDYENEKNNNRQFFDWFTQLPAEQKKLVARGELAPPAKPHEYWDFIRAINPAALQGYNALLAEWRQGQDVFPELLRVVLQMTAQMPNDVESAEKAWDKICKAHGLEKPKTPKALQLLNPAQGKGINGAKARWSNPGNVTSSWLLEWLKVVGLYQAAVTRQITKTKDRKTYVLHPIYLEWGTHQTVMRDFRQAMVSSATAVKLDILAVLRYTLAFLKHYEEAKGDDQAYLIGKRPSDLVSGMEMAFYKSLGQSAAVMNIASINLPRWVNPQAVAFGNLRTALDEHLAIVRGLDEARGEQFNLLGMYRDFLSGNDLNPFFEFTTAYSGFIISQRERHKPVRQFTTDNLEVMIVNSDTSQKTYSTILQDEGFKNVAYAIRHSTVAPQGRKARGSKPAVGIRYGLGQQLARKANYPDEFLAELAAFLQSYNAENSQLRENKREPFRKNVTTEDIEAVTALVDKYGAKVVCNLLIAYGYAKTPFEKADDGEGAPTDDLESESSDEGDEAEEAE